MTLAIKIQVLSFKNEFKGFRELGAGKKGATGATLHFSLFFENFYANLLGNSFS